MRSATVIAVATCMPLLVNRQYQCHCEHHWHCVPDVVLLLSLIATNVYCCGCKRLPGDNDLHSGCFSESPIPIECAHDRRHDVLSVCSFREVDLEDPNLGGGGEPTVPIPNRCSRRENELCARHPMRLRGPSAEVLKS